MTYALSNGSVFSSLKKAAILMLLPVAELLFLRWYLHSVLDLRFGWGNTTDFDYILPIPVAFLVLIIALEKDRPCRLSPHRSILLTNIVFLGSFLLLNHSLDLVTSWSTVLFPSLWFAFLSVIVISAFSGFSGVSFYTENRFRFALLPCLLVASSMYLYNNHFNFLWAQSAPLTTQSVCHSIRAVLPEMQCYFNAGGRMVLAYPDLIVGVDRGCGGLEGMLLVTFLFSLFIAMNSEIFTPWQWLSGFLMGLTLMFVLNVIRIDLIILFAASLLKMGWEREGADFLVTLFHINAGWIIYSLGLGAYCYALLWLAKKQLARMPDIGLSRAG